MDEYQVFINWTIAVGTGTAGWFIRILWEAVGELKRDLKDIEVNLPVSYVNKADFQLIMQRYDSDRHREHAEVMGELSNINSKFDRVYDKLEHKVDKA